MSSYTKWDRAAYIERVGGEEEAEGRRKVLMARQSGQRLAEERKRGHYRRSRPLHQSTRRAARPHRQLRRPHPDSHHYRGSVTATGPDRACGRAARFPLGRHDSVSSQGAEPPRSRGGPFLHVRRPSLDDCLRDDGTDHEGHPHLVGQGHRDHPRNPARAHHRNSPSRFPERSERAPIR